MTQNNILSSPHRRRKLYGALRATYDGFPLSNWSCVARSMHKNIEKSFFRELETSLKTTAVATAVGHGYCPQFATTIKARQSTAAIVSYARRIMRSEPPTVAGRHGSVAGDLVCGCCR